MVIGGSGRGINGGVNEGTVNVKRVINWKVAMHLMSLFNFRERERE